MILVSVIVFVVIDVVIVVLNAGYAVVSVVGEARVVVMILRSCCNGCSCHQKFCGCCCSRFCSLQGGFRCPIFYHERRRFATVIDVDTALVGVV